MSSLSNASGIANDNVIDGSGVSIPSQGYEVWNVHEDSPALISGGTVSNVDIGVFVNNYEGYNQYGTNGAHTIIDGITINAKENGTGIKVLDSDDAICANAANPGSCTVEHAPVNAEIKIRI